MASSNRHWPSMFKSKLCNSHHHQWQHDHNINPSLISNPTCHRSPFSSSVPGCEERSPEPKPRWNPKPEQIRILESIFNSGMVNPPRDEIRRIRAQLQEYGQVGDANVFYWFQNRKSRSKHKQRHHQNTPTTKSQHHNLSPPTTIAAATAITTAHPPSSSSSSSDKSSQKSSAYKASFPVNIMDGLNSPSASVNQPHFHTPPGEFLPEPFFFPVQQTPATGAATTTIDAAFTQGFFFPELLSSNNVVHHGSHDQTIGNCSSVLLTDLMMNLGPMNNYKKVEDQEKIKLQQQQQLGYTVTNAPISAAHTILPPTITINHIQGVGVGQGKSTVFINDVAFEVAVGPFNVREAFGDDAVLINSSGQPVVTNEWGVTLQSLQHGAFYYLI